MDQDGHDGGSGDGGSPAETTAAAAPAAAAAAAVDRGGTRRRRRPGPFTGLTEEAFSFFAALAADNSRAWFAAHQSTYRELVDRPWRALAAGVAPAVAALLTELDTTVATGHALSRIQFQWPRPGAAYRTGLRATFGPSGQSRPPCRLFVALDAAGVRAGLEVLAGGEHWRRLQGRLGGESAVRDAGAPDLCPTDLQWYVAGQPLPMSGATGAQRAPTVAEAMAGAGRRGAVRAARAWTAEEAQAMGSDLGAAVRQALVAAAPAYLAAAEPDVAVWLSRVAALAGETGAPAEETAASGAVGAARSAPMTSGDPPADAWPALPRDLWAALTRRARSEGVAVHALVVFALTRAAYGRCGPTSGAGAAAP